MKLKFLTEPALFLEPMKILVVADLHLGAEFELRRHGLHVPFQTEKLRERLDKLIKETKAKRLIFLGDIKDEVLGLSWIEMQEVPQFFEHLLKKVKISIIKGNHDGGIERILPKGIELYDSRGFVIDNVAFTHGNAWPDKKLLDAEYLITGHLHPAVEFWSSNVRVMEHCWVKCNIDQKKLEKKYNRKTSLKTGIIVPTFNHLKGGVAINSEKFEPNKTNDPLLNNEILKWKESEIFLLDGTFLGKLNEIKNKIKG